MMSKVKHSKQITQPKAGPDNKASEELSDEQLDQVAGGAMTYPPDPIINVDFAVGDAGQTGGGGSGGGTGKVRLSDISITKTTDKSSPIL
jgi:hypothetical protein